MIGFGPELPTVLDLGSWQVPSRYRFVTAQGTLMDKRETLLSQTAGSALIHPYGTVPAEYISHFPLIA